MTANDKLQWMLRLMAVGCISVGVWHACFSTSKRRMTAFCLGMGLAVAGWYAFVESDDIVLFLTENAPASLGPSDASAPRYGTETDRIVRDFVGAA